MDQISEILLRRLEEKGLGSGAIPGFIRDVVYTISGNDSIGGQEITRRLHLLGWHGIELDDHTMQLIIASVERSAYKQTGRYEDIYISHLEGLKN